MYAFKCAYIRIEFCIIIRQKQALAWPSLQYMKHSKENMGVHPFNAYHMQEGDQASTGLRVVPNSRHIPSGYCNHPMH